MSRDPLRVLTDLLFEWSRQRYVWIITSALGAAQQQQVDATLWTLLYVLAYLVVGYAWTHAKLFIDVWQGALPPALDAEVREVYDRKLSYWAFVARIKWHVMQWMITWPVSILYTIARHPLRMLADALYQISHKKYMWIVGKAMEMRMKQYKHD